MKLENEQLKEMMDFKDTKITELQQEIERLRLVVKLDNQSQKKMSDPPSITKLEKKLDEIAETGKIEYKICVNPPENSSDILQDEKSINKIMNLPQAALAKALLTQSKMLEEKLSASEQKSETEIVQKFNEMLKERKDLEKTINRVLEYEKNLQAKYSKLQNFVENLGQNDPETTKQQVLKIKDEWRGSLRYSSSEDEKNLVSESPLIQGKTSFSDNLLKESIKIGLEEIHEDLAESSQYDEKISETLNNKNLEEFADIFKSINYELPNQNAAEIIQKLRLICKLRDLQVEKLKAKLLEKNKSEKVSDIIKIEEIEKNSLLNEYEAFKEKYILADKEIPNEKNVMNEDQKSEIIKLKKEINNKDNTIKEISVQLEEAKRIIADNQQQICQSNENIEAESPPKKSIIGQEQLDALKSENTKNKQVIEELLESTRNTTQGKANKVLYEQNVDLTNKIQSLSQELDQIKFLLDDLSTEHIVAITKLENLLIKSGNIKSESINNLTEKSFIKGKSTHDQLLCEIELARKISLCINQISFSITQGDTKLSPEMLENFHEEIKQTRIPANDSYKEFFCEERTYPLTIETLLERIKHKNQKYKELYKLYEKLETVNESLINSQKNARVSPMKLEHTPSKIDFSEFEMLKKQNEDQIVKISELMNENNELKEIIVKIDKSQFGLPTEKPIQNMLETQNSEEIIPENINKVEKSVQKSPVKLPEKSVQTLEKIISDKSYENMQEKLNEKEKEILKINDKIEAMQTELQLSNSQLKEYMEEIQNKENIILAKDKEIEQLKNEGRKLLEQIRQIEENNLSDRSYKKSDQSLIKSPTSNSKISSQYENSYLKQELTEVKRQNELLQQKATELHQKLYEKTNTAEKLAHENRGLSTELLDHKKLLETTAQEKSEAHKLLNENLTEYKKGFTSYKEELRNLKEQLKESQTSTKKIDQFSRLIEKIKSLKENNGALSARLLGDDFYTANSIIEEIKDQLISNKRQIESLQNAVNTLQSERQLFVKNNTPIKSISPMSTKKQESPENESAKKILKNSLQKFENWFDSIQNYISIISKNLQNLSNSDKKNTKIYDPSEIKIILEKASILIPKLRLEILQKDTEISDLKKKIKYTAENSYSEQKYEAMVKKLSDLEKQHEKAKKDQERLENLLQKQKLESQNISQKGIYIFLLLYTKIVKDDIIFNERKLMLSQIEKIKEEGILIGQKQQRLTQATEIEKMTNLLKSYRKELEELKKSQKISENEKQDLEKYNKKANEEILTLIETLKNEQEKQRNLSSELEILTKELKMYRMKNIDSNFE